MVETRIPASIDAIVAALKGAGLTVWDGPILTGDYSNAVYVGYDANPAPFEHKASDTAQAWAGIGQRKRDEANNITCAIVVLAGEDDPSWKPTRDTVFGLLETVGQTLRSDPSLAQTPTPFVAELMPGEYFQEPGPNGYQARIVFTVHIKTRV